MVSLALRAGAQAAQDIEPVPARMPVIPTDLKNGIVAGQLKRFRKSSLMVGHFLISQPVVAHLSE